MILSPFDPVTLAVLAAVLNRTQEQPVQTANDFARRLALLGKPGPFKSSSHNPGLIVDRAGDILLMISPDVMGPATRRDAAEITALALNRLCGFSAVEDQVGSAQIAVVQAASAQIALLTHQQAAE